MSRFRAVEELRAEGFSVKRLGRVLGVTTRRPSPIVRYLPRQAPPGLLEDLPWAFSAGPFRTLGHRFRLRTMSRPLGKHLEHLWASARTDGDGPTTVYSFVERGTPRWPWALYADRERVGLYQDASWFVGDLFWHVNAATVAGSVERFVLVHAGVADLGGAGVLLHAPSGAGKSTLTAALTTVGGWRYLSDEIAAVDPENLSVHAYPRPIAVRPGSFNALGPAVAPVPPRLAHWFATKTFVAPSCTAERTNIRLVVTPRYGADGGTTLEPVTRAEMLRLLIGNTFEFFADGPRNLRVLGELVRAARCYRLQFDDVHHAGALLRAALDD